MLLVPWQLPNVSHYGSMGLVYLPTFTIKSQPNVGNVGKYTIHGWYGFVKMEDFSPNEGTMVVNNPLIRPYFLLGVAVRGH